MSNGFPFFLFIALVILAIFIVTLLTEVLIRVMSGPVLLDPETPKKKAFKGLERRHDRASEKRG